MKTIRTIAERLSRGITVKRKMIVGGKHIPVYVSPDAQLKYLKFGKNTFDSDLIDIAEKYLNPSSNVWDIGANVGVFSFAASAIAEGGLVLSVEADIWLANILRKTANLQYYRGHDIRVLPCAISHEHSVACFQIAKRGRASNALESAGGRSQMGGIRELQFVPTTTLDSLLDYFDAPNFVKIDIEGAELKALHGSKQLISVVRPTFYIEVGEDVSDEVFTIFNAADYIARSPEGEQLTKCVSNTLFFPKKK